MYFSIFLSLICKESLIGWLLLYADVLHPRLESSPARGKGTGQHVIAKNLKLKEANLLPQKTI